MSNLIDKDALVAEIDRRMSVFYEEKSQKEATQIDRLSLGARIAMLEELKVFINTLEVKEVDLEKEIQRQYNVHKNPDNRIVKDCVIMTKDGFEYFAKHFFDIGVKAQKGE